MTCTLMTIAVTITISCAPCECTFSSMERLKDYLRDSMSDDRLQHDFGILNTEKDISKILDLDKAVNRFDAKSKDLRIVLH